MILPDSYNDIDTGLLFEYKGHRILNLVDCCSPNGNHLPSPVDLLLTDFASGASGFPACFSEMFDEKTVEDMARDKAAKFASKIAKHVQECKPRAWMPFAGYFVEAAPGDELVRRLNLKNRPEKVAANLRARFPGLVTWLPFPGGVFDIGSAVGEVPERAMAEYEKDAWDFEPFLAPLRESMDFAPLKSTEGVRHYFSWAQFGSYNLVLHLIEASDDFSVALREWFVDFAVAEPVFLSAAPPTRPLLRIRARATVLRNTMMRGESWDSLYIGFSARFFSKPNIYHHKFLNHFMNDLPEEPPF